ncbi:ABC transporter ATP-binding protein [Candidatus Roizmanbacteria bacterium RIFOXYB2_FULL_38_10]|uniref:ABC transporter ATP-binding protein n=1 Tax=Candidatus Roizmanbacteria bacterium RIFOXYD1_FULL_38_12 TaxID=1802093 RepID=A0A1F7KZJ4_9BACT|nr:MAG: ABC transporter ATP-binding protein [Candidatus Roizmanbacteria bacterium RIFOXYA2_FULL_38_14]OGK63248.1 MAG: ABC transporter ATP-binding protein [Candidatus Roizmanbacteria bacterium RIFOXYA1_FULL_37_12]OGK65094.1 MAG: ABC transporter ATP-binding protein [Candidatus Roizmanbacteria bacterium RIFOXYB1_FULL_40_23]OGK68648.1 MAG: ABC transporter ATP-binding protein [Candidatus Roizmanbacteria bacterium RIFOXYB2_FULL_38_10]OGK69498.1 MAG: ABC transporter ATP-binding protein [Candidatus Roi
MSDIIKVDKVWKEYMMGDVLFQALKDINILVKEGELSAIVGPSGSGKSTLMHIIGLLDKPTRGKVFIQGKDISTFTDNKISTLRNEFVGFVFQQFNLINKLTILENIMLPSIYARRKLNYDPKEKALYLIKRFGLVGKENSYPNKISGGQQQRVAIARALIMNPKLILADEPTGNLDSKSGNEILKLLKELNHKEKMTVIIVTHDQLVAKETKRIIQIRDGEVVA